VQDVTTNAGAEHPPAPVSPSGKTVTVIVRPGLARRNIGEANGESAGGLRCYVASRSPSRLAMEVARAVVRQLTGKTSSVPEAVVKGGLEDKFPEAFEILKLANVKVGDSPRCSAANGREPRDNPGAIPARAGGEQLRECCRVPETDR
jgi:hypothetical protein